MEGKLRPGGRLLLVENVEQAFERQTSCRRAAGLPARRPAAFNLFLDEDLLLRWVEEQGLELVGHDDFGSLHDLVLYVLVPLANGGEVDYEHPLVAAATDLSLAT